MQVRSANLVTGAGRDEASFGETNWWVINKARQPNTAGADAARESLCQSYWWPVFLYLRRVGYGLEDSQDLTQSFFARVFEKNYLQAAAREQGKFRSFLLVVLKRFLADERDRRDCQKRGGKKEIISLDSGDTAFRTRNEPADEVTPEKVFERNWANALLRQALYSLEKEMVAAGKKSDFQQLKSLVTCEGHEAYAEVAQRLHWSESNIKVTVHRLRRRLGDLLRSEIAKTATTLEEVEEEIRNLFSTFN